MLSKFTLVNEEISEQMFGSETCLNMKKLKVCSKLTNKQQQDKDVEGNSVVQAVAAFTFQHPQIQFVFLYKVFLRGRHVLNMTFGFFVTSDLL